MDLSTLEALDAQLPALIAYAQAIGYEPFAHEVLGLRIAAARRALDSRVRALSEASVVEIQAQSDALRSYAAKIGVDGADAALTQMLTAARMREFKQEAAKHPLNSPEDCDRNLPLLEAYASRIGFDGFHAWAEITRQRVAASVRKNAKEAQAENLTGTKTKAGVKSHAPAKPMEIALGFVLIAIVALCIYTAYTHLMKPAEASPTATMLQEEDAVATPIETPIEARIEVVEEPSWAPQPEWAAPSVEARVLPPLSPAAEEAIRDGFVDITDPAVAACTDAKAAEFRKEMGDDALLNYAVFNEFAVACGFNI